MTLSTKLLEILVCPLCQQPVVHAESDPYLDCMLCQLRFPVQDGIPVMLVEEAKKVVSSPQVKPLQHLNTVND